MSSCRNDLYRYAKKKYQAEPEYPWKRFPGYAVLRHRDQPRWFGLIMDVPARKLGLDSPEVKDILNVKLSDPMLAEALLSQEGFFRGCHISRGNWISILLDGTVAVEEICRWLDESYLNTASQKEKQKMRPPKDWLIPANPKIYDIQAAFQTSKVIDWKQGKGIKKGDTVYIYAAAPVSAILYKCRVIKTDIPFQFDEGAVHMTSLMKIRLQKQYPPEQFPFERLGREYGIRAVRGPRGIPSSLLEALEQ